MNNSYGSNFLAMYVHRQPKKEEEMLPLAPLKRRYFNTWPEQHYKNWTKFQICLLFSAQLVLTSQRYFVNGSTYMTLSAPPQKDTRTSPVIMAHYQCPLSRWWGGPHTERVDGFAILHFTGCLFFLLQLQRWDGCFVVKRRHHFRPRLHHQEEIKK